MLYFPNENLTAEFTRAASSPMDVSTCEGFTAPAEQADPVDTATPFKSSAESKFSPRQPKNDTFRCAGRISPPPLRIADGISDNILVNRRSRNAAVFFEFFSAFLQAMDYALASPTALAVLTVPPRSPRSCIPPEIKPEILTPFFINSAPAPFGP